MDLQLPMQSVPIITDVASSNLDFGRDVRHYVIKLTITINGYKPLFFLRGLRVFLELANTINVERTNVKI